MREYTEDEIRSMFESTIADKKDLNRENWDYVSEQVQTSWISFRDGFNKAVDIMSKPGIGYIAINHGLSRSDVWCIAPGDKYDENLTIPTTACNLEIPDFFNLIHWNFKYIGNGNSKNKLLELGFKVVILGEEESENDDEDKYPDGSTFLVG